MSAAVLTIPHGPVRGVIDALRARGYPLRRARALATIVDRQPSELARWQLVKRLLGCGPIEAREHVRKWGYG